MVKYIVEFLFDAAVAGGDAFDHRLEIAEIIKLVIQQVRARDVGQSGRQVGCKGGLVPWYYPFPVNWYMV